MLVKCLSPLRCGLKIGQFDNHFLIFPFLIGKKNLNLLGGREKKRVLPVQHCCVMWLSLLSVVLFVVGGLKGVTDVLTDVFWSSPGVLEGMDLHC